MLLGKEDWESKNLNLYLSVSRDLSGATIYRFPITFPGEKTQYQS
jgi:hypothetical protein